MKTQLQYFYDSHKKIAALNEMFMELIKYGDITNEELKILIEKRPEIYGRFSGFIGKLKKGKL